MHDHTFEPIIDELNTTIARLERGALRAAAETARALLIEAAIPCPEPAAFRVWLARLREVRDYSQAQLAESADLDHSHVSRIESGRRHASAETVARLCRALALKPVEIDLMLVAAGFAPRTVAGVECIWPPLVDRVIAERPVSILLRQWPSDAQKQPVSARTAVAR